MEEDKAERDSQDVSCPYCGGSAGTSEDFTREFARDHGNQIQSVWQQWVVRECHECREQFATLKREETDA